MINIQCLKRKIYRGVYNILVKSGLRKPRKRYPPPFKDTTELCRAIQDAFLGEDGEKYHDLMNHRVWGEMIPKEKTNGSKQNK